MKEETRKLKTWILPKEVIVQEIKQQIQSQELMIKQINENLAQGFYIKQQLKTIIEQTSEASKKLHELELERIKRDLDANYYTIKAQLVLDGLKESLKREEEIVEGIKKKIMMSERNHKIKETPKEDEKTN